MSFERIARVWVGSVLSAMAALAAAGHSAAAAVPSVAPVPSVPSAPAGGLRQVVVDSARTTGTLRTLQGVNGAPGPGLHKPPHFTFGGWNVPEGVDATAGYREARIDLVRTHDAYGPGDIDARFGPPRSTGQFEVPAERSGLVIFPDRHADPDDPKSYRFGPTDRLIASIVAIGAQPIFRLGRSETSDVTPPRDLERYASIAEHIVLHYNRGWDQGYRYGLRYWEVWNEPDLDKLFWGGTPQEFYELYARLARAVKRADPAALVGGPTLAKPDRASPYRDGFLEFVRARHLPLDFFTWHWYPNESDDPRDFVRLALDVRARLDRFGFGRTLSVLDEWNYGLEYPLPSDLRRAAFVASSLIEMAHAPIDLAALYRADNLFGYDGTQPSKTGAALIALGRMKDTRVELPVEAPPGPSDACGFAVEAGRSPDGRTIQVLVSHYQAPADDQASGPGRCRASAGYELTVLHLRPGALYEVERDRISATSTLAPAARTLERGPSVRVSAALPAPGIELIVIRSAGRL